MKKVKVTFYNKMEIIFSVPSNQEVSESFIKYYMNFEHIKDWEICE